MCLVLALIMLYRDPSCPLSVNYHRGHFSKKTSVMKDWQVLHLGQNGTQGLMNHNRDFLESPRSQPQETGDHV